MMAEQLYALGLGSEDSNPNVAKIAIEQRKKKTEVVEPQVISEDLLIDGVEEPVKPNPEEQWDPIDFPKVISMKLSFLNIIEIANLCNFDSLTTLRLDNNIIDKIVNLKSLKNLTWLDLSFNNIREIENLDSLSNLTDLSLYHNQIEEIKGLDGCPKLNILSLGHNKIQELKQIDKLRPFQNLRCVCLEGNKVCSHDSYNQHVLAHLTNLKYLDYMLIDKKAVAQAMEAFQAHDELAEKVEEEAAAQAIENAKKEKEAIREKLRESFLDSTDDLFEELFAAEVEPEHLKALTCYQPLKEDYKDKLADEIRALKQGMEKPNEDRLRKANAFEKALYNAEEESEGEAFQMVRDFRSIKKQVLASLDPEGNAPQKNVDMMIQQLLEQLTALQNLLMANEVQLQESIEEAIGEFDSKVNEIVKVMIEKAGAFFEKITDYEKNFDQCLRDTMATELDAFAQNQGMDGDIENQNKAKYLQDRDEMGRQCGNLNEFHLTLIGSKEEKMTGDMTNWMKVFVNQHQERQYHRNRQRIMDIKKVIEECRDEINAAQDAVGELDDEHDNGHDAYVR